MSTSRKYVTSLEPPQFEQVILEGFSIRNCVAKQGGALSFRRVRQVPLLLLLDYSYD